MSGKPCMNGDGESYCGRSPTNQPNKSEKSPAEVVEGRLKWIEFQRKNRPAEASYPARLKQ